MKNILFNENTYHDFCCLSKYKEWLKLFWKYKINNNCPNNNNHNKLVEWNFWVNINIINKQIFTTKLHYHQLRDLSFFVFNYFPFLLFSSIGW